MTGPPAGGFLCHGVYACGHGRTAVIHVDASRTGASAISSLPPAGADSFQEVRRYYQQLAAASDIPLLVYYFPEVSASHGRDEICAAGLLAEARTVQDRMNHLIRLILRFPALPAIEKILAWSGLDCGPALARRRALTSDEEAKLRRSLHHQGFAELAAHA